MRIAFGENGYLLWNDANGYHWCGGDKSDTDGGVGQVNQPVGAPDDCKGHTLLGSGWDFSSGGSASQYNQGLTMCGIDGLSYLHNVYANQLVSYPNAGMAFVIWTR